jgi:hypothetical protein
MTAAGQKRRSSQPRHVSFRRQRTLVRASIRWSSRPTLLRNLQNFFRSYGETSQNSRVRGVAVLLRGKKAPSWGPTSWGGRSSPGRAFPLAPSEGNREGGESLVGLPLSSQRKIEGAAVEHPAASRCLLRRLPGAPQVLFVPRSDRTVVPRWFQERVADLSKEACQESCDSRSAT